MGDREAWLLYCVEENAEKEKKAGKNAQDLNTLLATDKVRLAELGRLSGSANQVMDALFSHPVANIGALHQQTGLTHATIGKVLDALEHQLGLVREITGQKRNRVYAYTAYIDILNRD